jgi:hypothetical protein
VQPLLQWKVISITYPERLFEAFGIQYKMRMCHIVVCGLLGSKTFFHIVIESTIFEKEKSY